MTAYNYLLVTGAFVRSHPGPEFVRPLAVSCLFSAPDVLQGLSDL